MDGLAEAMRKDYLYRLQVLEIQARGDREENTEGFYAALADGLCPKIDTLVLDIQDEWDDPFDGHRLAAVLRSRMEEGRGCCGLKSLVVKDAPYLSLLLPTGAYEALEELKVENRYCGYRSTKEVNSDAVMVRPEKEEDLSEWLLRTKAPNLDTLHLDRPPQDVMSALCLPGMAPRLQSLSIESINRMNVLRLNEAIGRGVSHLSSRNSKP